MVARLIRPGLLQPLDYANIPNASNLESALQDVSFDPGRQYSLPWQSGFAGIAYNTKATGGKKVESMTQLLTDPALKGKVTLLTEMRDTVGLVLLEQGKDPANFTDADFEAAIAEIQKAKDAGQLQGSRATTTPTASAAGDIAACVAWTGDVVAAGRHPGRLGYDAPRDAAGRSGRDNFVIPAMAKHKKNAEKLIDYYYEPEVMAEVEAWVNYISPVKGTKDAMAKDRPGAGREPAHLPEPRILSQGQEFRGLSADEETKYNRAVLDPHHAADGASTSGDLRLVGLTKTFERLHRRRPLDLVIPRGLVLRPARAVGLRQDDDPAHGGRARAADRGADPHRRHRHHRHPAHQRNVNTVFQRYALFPHMNVMRQRRLRAAAAGRQGRQGARPRRRSSWCSSARWPARSRPSCRAGMQQRVALARAVVNRPDVLLLDEPLGALDLKLRRQMQIELKRIQQEVGLTFIHVTHDQEEAMTMADTIAVMNAGRIEQLGDPAILYERPASTFVANFLGQSNLSATVAGPASDGEVLVKAHESLLRVAGDHVPDGCTGDLARGAPREAAPRRARRTQPARAGG